MNKELKVLFEDSKSIVLKWEKSSDETCEYVILGKDENFNDIRINKVKEDKITLDKSALKNYISITIEYVIKENNKEIVIDRTNTIDIENLVLKVLNVKALKSYKNITLLIESQDIYDKYCIYEKSKDNYNLILDCEDFIINSEIFKKNKTYKIEAYKKIDDEYKLCGIKNDYKIEEFYKTNNPKKVDISIVIAVYNCELYLSRCLDSIILSTFKNIEVILVNDGSTDSSIDIINYYKNTYNKIFKVIDKENGGPASARNEGIRHITGKYTAFFDSDDFIHPYMLEKCFEVALETDADVVTSKVIYRDFGKNDIWFESNEKTTDKRYTIQGYEDMIYHKRHDVEHNVYLVTLWNRIMKSDIIKAHPIPNLKYYEDAAYTRLIYSYLDKFALSLDSYYVWDRRLSKTTGTITINLGKSGQSDLMNETYVEALFYFINDCNMDRFDYMIYDALKDLEPNANVMVDGEKEASLSKSYVRKMIEIMDKYDLTKNKYAMEDQDLIKTMNKVNNLRRELDKQKKKSI